MAAWELTADGAVVAGKEFKLREAVKADVLLDYGDRTGAASEALSIVMAALDEIASGRGDCEDLAGRIRKTMEARRAIRKEIVRLSGIFSEFFEPAGILDCFADNEMRSKFSLDVLQHFIAARK